MRNGMSLNIPITPMVRKIMQFLTVAYLLAEVVLILELSVAVQVWEALSLVHGEVFSQLKLWTLVTHGILHAPATLTSLIACAATAWAIVKLYDSPWARREYFLFLLLAFASIALLQAFDLGAPLHLLFNLLMLYFFGHLFEDRWGPRRFLFFWTLCIFGGGVLSSVLWYAFPNLAGPSVIGASAGGMGLLAAYAVYFPNQQVFYGFVVPIKGKHILLIAIVFDLISLADKSNHVAVFAHLGGVVTGLLLTTGYWRPGKIGAALNKKKPKRRKKPHLRVVKNDDDDPEPPRYLH